MIRSSVHFAFAAGADDIARTILFIAEKRATTMDALLLVRLRGIKRRIWPLRVARQSAFVCERLVIIRPIPVAAPFPNIASHIVKPVAISWERFHRRNPGVTVFAC